MNRMCLAVNGQSRTGKSYLVKNEIIPAVSEQKPVIIFDKLAEYTKADPDCPDWFTVHDSFADFIEHLKNVGTLSGVHVLKCKRDSAFTYGFDFFEKLSKPVCIVIDEGHDLFLDADFKRAKKKLIKMTRYGGHYGIDIIFISQRTKDVPPNFRSQITGVISFRQTSVEDVKCLESNAFDNVKQIYHLENNQYKVFGELPNYLNLK